MKSSRQLTLLAIAGLALFISACSATGPASWPGIAVDEKNNTAFIAFNQQLYSVQADNGTENWRFPAKKTNAFSVFSAPQLTADGQLIFGAYDHIFYSVNPASGATNWTFEGAANRYIASPLNADDVIYAPNSEGVLYALSNRGDLLWTFGTDQPQWSQPVSDGAAVYVGALDHHLYAVNARNGEEIWDTDLGGTLVGSPIVNNGVIYIGTLNSEVVALSSTDGAVLWRAATSGWVWGSPLFSNDQILVGDLNGNLYALDAASGKQVWSLDTGGSITGAPLLENDHIYIVNEAGKVLSVSPEGAIEWTKTFEAKLYGSPVASGDLLLVSEVATEGVVLALDQEGNLVWTFLPKN